TRAVPHLETGWIEGVIRRDDRLCVGRQRDSLGRALPRGADGDRVDQLARTRVHVHTVVVLSAAHEVRSVGREPEARRAVRCKAPDRVSLEVAESGGEVARDVLPEVLVAGGT